MYLIKYGHLFGNIECYLINSLIRRYGLSRALDLHNTLYNSFSSTFVKRKKELNNEEFYRKFIERLKDFDIDIDKKLNDIIDNFISKNKNTKANNDDLYGYGKTSKENIKEELNETITRIGERITILNTELRMTIETIQELQQQRPLEAINNVRALRARADRFLLEIENIAEELMRITRTTPPEQIAIINRLTEMNRRLETIREDLEAAIITLDVIIVRAAELRIETEVEEEIEGVVLRTGEEEPKPEDPDSSGSRSESSESSESSGGPAPAGSGSGSGTSESSESSGGTGGSGSGSGSGSGTSESSESSGGSGSGGSGGSGSGGSKSAETDKSYSSDSSKTTQKSVMLKAIALSDTTTPSNTTIPPNETENSISLPKTALEHISTPNCCKKSDKLDKDVGKYLNKYMNNNHI